MSWFGFIFFAVVVLPIIVGVVLPEDDRNDLIEIFIEPEQEFEGQLGVGHYDDPTPVYTEKLHKDPAPRDFEKSKSKYVEENARFLEKMKQDCIDMGLSNC